MLDGRHTGTGGGNHVVLGGADAGRQPVPAPARPAAQPDRLLAQPSVAVVPVLAACSSARRARRRASTRRATTALYELEIAFAQMPPPGRPAPPWLVDRVFRNLLVDVTGNTHRAEFCIDKLYSPDSRAGRLGPARAARLRDAAARAHEPGAAAAAARADRALLAASRTSAPLVRWGTELHDRFMLPHFVWQDFARRARRAAATPAIRSSPSGSRRTSSSASRCSASVAHARRRRSSCARRSSRGTCSARSGAAAARRATSIRRSSGCRCKVDGPDRRSPRRHLQRPRACRCTPPATAGEFVAGVRYRAWQPPTRCIRRSACTRRWSSTSSTPGAAARSAAAPITSPIPAAATTTASRSTPTRPRPAASRASSRSATRPATSPEPRPIDNPEHPLTLDLRRA